MLFCVLKPDNTPITSYIQESIGKDIVLRKTYGYANTAYGRPLFNLTVKHRNNPDSTPPPQSLTS